MRKLDDGYSWKYDPIFDTFLPEDFAVHLSAYWREVTAPMLICWGTETWTTNPATDGNSAFFRDHRNLTFDGAGHWTHHGQLNNFVAGLRDFL